MGKVRIGSQPGPLVDWPSRVSSRLLLLTLTVLSTALEQRTLHTSIWSHPWGQLRYLFPLTSCKSGEPDDIRTPWAEKIGKSRETSLIILLFFTRVCDRGSRAGYIWNLKLWLDIFKNERFDLKLLLLSQLHGSS